MLVFLSDVTNEKTGKTGKSFANIMNLPKADRKKQKGHVISDSMVQPRRPGPVQERQ